VVINHFSLLRSDFPVRQCDGLTFLPVIVSLPGLSGEGNVFRGVLGQTRALIESLVNLRLEAVASCMEDVNDANVGWVTQADGQLALFVE
jgi:hypothetical protein